MTDRATRSWLKEERISGLLGGNDDDNDDDCADADDGGDGEETHLMTLGFRHLSVDKDFQQAVLSIN